MSKSPNIFLITGIILTIIFSCTKDKKPLPASALADVLAPKISFVSVTPKTIKQYQDSLTFEIAYRDTDGDLGQNDPSVFNLFLTDNRINVTYNYRIPQLAPDTSITIQGNLVIVLLNTRITDSSASQTATYSIYIKDRAGHSSNTVTSTPVTIQE